MSLDNMSFDLDMVHCFEAYQTKKSITVEVNTCKYLVDLIRTTTDMHVALC